MVTDLSPPGKQCEARPASALRPACLQFARLIIHEATHTFCGTSDVRYAHAQDYLTQAPRDMVWNADSYGFAAVSIAADTFYDSDTLEPRA